MIPKSYGLVRRVLCKEGTHEHINLKWSKYTLHCSTKFTLTFIHIAAPISALPNLQSTNQHDTKFSAGTFSIKAIYVTTPYSTD